MNLSDSFSYASKTTGRKTHGGHRLRAVLNGIPDLTPNFLASYEAAETTPLFAGSPLPPTIRGLPLSSGLFLISTDAKKASMSTCITKRSAIVHSSCHCDGVKRPKQSGPKGRCEGM